ncbi:MAG: hypothetical protein WC509_02250 [Candidatus Izemoplasmatales bacterium]
MGPAFYMQFFEIAMLLLFGASWPVAVVRAYRARTAKGASLTSAILILVGYSMGIVNKLVNGSVNYVLGFYVLNFTIVSIYCLMLWRNIRIDRNRDAKTV